MSKESVYQLTDDIERVIKRHRYESELTLAEVVGCLEVVKTSIINSELDDMEDY